MDETGEVHAHVFFVAYVVTNRGAHRPLTFAWNGGPTLPSVYVHTEFLSPRRLDRTGFVDNPATALAATDLVFYDPVETGFSRPSKPEFAAEFLNMKGDIAATSEFIRAYRGRFGAETQPLFILGESYGAWRAAGVSEFLADRHVGIAGVILISGGFAGTKPSLAFSHAMDIQARAAGAFYYKRLPPELMRDRVETLRIVDQWAASTYLPALEHVSELSPEDRASIARQLAKFTGFPPEQIDPNTLVVNTSDYLSGFFAPDKARTLSELDLRISGDEAVEPTRSLQISHYLRNELGYNTDLTYSGELTYPDDVSYRALESGYVPTPGPARRRTGLQWSYNQSEEAPAALERLRATGDGAYLDAVNPPWIENAMTAEPNLRVFVAQGRFDPTNSCEGVRRIVAGLGAGLSGRIESRCYEGGHMMYRDETERIRLSDDLAKFITTASAGSRTAVRPSVEAQLLAEAHPPTEARSPAQALPPTDYSWLEAQHDPAAVAWAKLRRDRSLREIESTPAFPTVLRELRSALDIGGPLPEIFVLGNRLVRFTRDVQHPSGLLEVAPRSNTPPKAWRTVLDLAALNRDEHSSYSLSGLSFSDFPDRCLPPAFDRCLLALSPGGSSNLELREFDLEKGAFVSNGFRVPANRSFTAWLNQDTLLIAHSLNNSPALPSNFPAVVRLWRRGTPLTDAQPIFQAAPTDSLVDCRALGHGAQRRVLLSIVHDYSTVEFKLVDQSGQLTDLPIPHKVKYVGNVALSYPYVVVQLAEPATTAGGVTYPAESLIAYNIDPGVPNHQRYSTVYVPPKDSFVTDGYTGFTGAHSGIAFVVDHNLRQALWFAHPAPGKWSTRELLAAPPGVTLKVDGDRANDNLLVREEGFLTPPTVGLLDLTGRMLPIQASQPVVNAQDYLTEIRSARSKDGTGVDYYLVRPKKTGPDPVPTLMGGYGSFGVNYAPGYFSAELKLGMVSWLTRGGAFVAAAIRGGGERGEAWHLGGAGLKKQHAFDDFIAVAEDLVRSGFTRPDKLGAYGRSAGGLLTAVMATQRPDLFKAILVGVPVTDLADMGNGSGIVRGQKAEFGDWDDPAQLPSILAWSPYQNIRPGVAYPRLLVITSTEDNQVGPGQARRFAARLEEVGAHPLLIEEPTGGHGVPDQLKQPDLVAAEVTFFINTLMK